MARIRTIKPEFPQSESMGRVSRDARLLFIQLWPICDDHGRTRAPSRMLASLLFPYDDDAPSLMDGWVAELEREGCVKRYMVDGTQYLEVSNWLKHQKIDKPSKPQFPSFEEASRILAKARERSALDLDLDLDLDPDQGPRTEEQKRGAKTEKVQQVVPPPAAAVAAPDPIFGVGLQLLVSKGVPEIHARSYLGKLRQVAQGAAGSVDAGDLLVIECIAELQRQDVSDPVPWLRKAITARGNPKPANGHSRPGSIGTQFTTPSPTDEGIKGSPALMARLAAAGLGPGNA